MTAEPSVEARMVDYLLTRIATGDRYFRSKEIAQALDLSPHQVGARMATLADRCDDLAVAAWGRSRSTTWHVEPR